MPRVKYIGTNVKTDSITGVGLEWQPGQVRDVTATVAEHLLSYSDTWVRADGKADTPEEARKEHAVKKPQDKEEPIGYLEKDKHVEEPLPVVDFHGMNKDALQKYAREKWNLTLDKKWSESYTREQVVKEHTKRAMEDKDD